MSMIGRSIAHYTITKEIGRGGMGEVYLATDTKLKRKVAIKVLSEALAGDEQHLARLTREAEVLARLDHPGIAQIYGIEDTEGGKALVLQFIEGPTLAQRIAQGAMPVEEALPLALEIAEALEAAHEKGVIHRDLKPANIKITPDGKVKILDFGLAKAVVEEEKSPEDIANSPTLTMQATQAGIILGTPAYMSPEQARGDALDKRTDLWSFGCVLCQALTGRPVFEGNTAVETLSAILEREPDWEALPDQTPYRIRDLLRRCLRKDPNERLRDAGDARIAIDDALDEPEAGLPGVPPTIAEMTPRRRALSWGIGALAVVAALAIGASLGNLILQPAPPAPTRIPVAVPLGVELFYERYPSLAISPDGRSLVYLAQSNGVRRLYLQELDPRGDNRPIEGTEGATAPFFSPDGEWVGFFTWTTETFGGQGKLKKVALSGGSPVELAELPGFWGASWAPDDEILVSATRKVMRLPAWGGAPEAVTTPNRDRGEYAHAWPQLLPGGKAALYTVVAAQPRIAVTSLETGQQTILFESGVHLFEGGVQEYVYARYVPTGHIVFARGNSLMAIPFDLERLEAGTPVRILDNVVERGIDGAQYAVSANGALVYLSGSPDPGRTLVRIDADGTRQPLTSERRDRQDDLRISPDGQRIALEIYAQEGSDIWIYDISRDDFSRLTFEPGWESDPVWTPDGQKIAFLCGDILQAHLLWISADGSGSPEPLVTADGTPSSFSPDGELLAFVKSHPDTGDDIWIHSMEDPDASETYLATPFDEQSPVFSPDGSWIAYQSNQTGRSEIYVQPYPGPGRTWKLSTAGGREPRWSSDGKRIFYREGDRAMVVSREEGSGFLTSLPEPIADGLGREWDVSPNGEYVVTVESAPREPPRLNLILNWFEELKRLAPKG